MLKKAVSEQMAFENAVREQVLQSSRECICGSCPSYLETGETKVFFCGSGKSEVISEEKDCVCASCPVQARMAVRFDYYCLRGSGKQQLRESGGHLPFDI